MGSVTHDRKMIQQAYIRVCRDSGFQLDSHRAAWLTAQVLEIHALQVAYAMPSLGVLDEIARGTHPACDNNGEKI